MRIPGALKLFFVTLLETTLFHGLGSCWANSWTTSSAILASLLLPSFLSVPSCSTLEKGPSSQLPHLYCGASLQPRLSLCHAVLSLLLRIPTLPLPCVAASLNATLTFALRADASSGLRSTGKW